jgi:ribosomal silencing factor RsfS
MYPEASYLVCSSNNSSHGEAMADKILNTLNEKPLGVATLTRGLHNIKGKVLQVSDIMNKK